ncbi:unnamed protein product [Penicillium discolor]
MGSAPYGPPRTDTLEPRSRQIFENGLMKMADVVETAQVIGRLRSLAWPAGLDELVGAIDDPAYLIEDDIEVNPFGTSLLWLLERHMEEGTLPRRIWAKGSGNNPPVIPSSLITTVPATIPAAVKETLNTRNPSDLYPTS